MPELVLYGIRLLAKQFLGTVLHIEVDQSATNQTILTCNLSNGLELHVSDGIVEGAAGLSEVVRVDVAHPDMSRLHLLGQRPGSSVDIDQEGLTWHGMIYISVNQ